MSATALVSGKLFRDPERKASRDGKPFVAATLREGNGDAATWWKVLCFSESGCEELAALRDGDGLAVSGTFKAELYEKNGETRLSFTIFVDRVISARRQKRERREQDGGGAEPARHGTAGPREPAPIDDEIPF